MSATLKINVYDNYQTTDSYVKSKEVSVLEYNETLLWIKNHHLSNSVLYNVSVTLNEDDWEPLQEDETLGPGESKWDYLKRSWDRVCFEAKSLLMGQPGTIEAWIGRRP